MEFLSIRERCISLLVDLKYCGCRDVLVFHKYNLIYYRNNKVTIF